MSPIPAHIAGVSVLTKANVYFDGNVISHTVLSADGTKKTLGLIRPGSYHFNTVAAERMEIVAGTCHVQVDGGADAQDYATGTSFTIPAHSGFTIAVGPGIGLCEYICSFLA